MSKEQYTEIDVELNRVTENAIQVTNDDGEQAWIPRSLLHSQSDRDVEGTNVTSLKIMTWKLEQLGWA